MSARYSVARFKKVRMQQKAKLDFYNSHKEGVLLTLNSTLTNHTNVNYAVLAKYELAEDFYFIIQDRNEKVYLARVIYNGHAMLKKIAKESEEYRLHAKVFDEWIKEAKCARQEQIISFFVEHLRKKHKLVAVKKAVDEKGVSLHRYITKHIYDTKYYAILKTEENEYFVSRIVWFGLAQLVKVTEKEFNKTKEVFEFWLKDAKK